MPTFPRGPARDRIPSRGLCVFAPRYAFSPLDLQGLLRFSRRRRYGSAPENDMMRSLGVGIFLLGLVPLGAGADDASPGPFDGVWNTIVSCPNASGALGYSFEFPS